MRDFRDAKAMAHTMREALKAKSISLTHSESLNLSPGRWDCPTGVIFPHELSRACLSFR